jgi:hypothetical protein
MRLSAPQTKQKSQFPGLQSTGLNLFLSSRFSFPANANGPGERKFQASPGGELEVEEETRRAR